MPDTVIVAAPEYLPALQEQGEFGDALAFSDADALKALEAITRDRPKVIALERQFAATSRGAALIKRIKADPKLRKCEIRIVSHEGESEDVAQPEAAPASPEAAPVKLDQRGTRRAPRVKIVEGVEVLIDGSPATLIDLSVVGAQVISLTILRPNQRVRMVLPDEERPIRCQAGVAWAAFEMPKTGPRYRAGIEFFDAESGNLDRFIEQNRIP
ncbi:MAG TPA: PilZ domain-containing protein [Vicinamibacterales bacterium]|nr:PilZ domain-containing protein [Vicinamibacterales bacterium]